MKIVLDESVSYGLGEILRHAGHEVIAIAEAATAGNTDEEVFRLACDLKAVLITRDYHFTNHLRFPADKTTGIIYIRHGKLVTTFPQNIRPSITAGGWRLCTEMV